MGRVRQKSTYRIGPENPNFPERGSAQRDQFWWAPLERCLHLHPFCCASPAGPRVSSSGAALSQTRATTEGPPNPLWGHVVVEQSWHPLRPGLGTRGGGVCGACPEVLNPQPRRKAPVPSRQRGPSGLYHSHGLGRSASGSGRIQKTESEFGRIRRTNSHSRITLEASRKVNRLRRVWSEFGLRSRSR